MKITRPTKVELVGHGTVTLKEGDHLATGGEGSVYAQSGLVIKLYTDPRKMAHDGMADKLSLLAGIKHPHIIAPRGLVLDSASRPIGFYMNQAVGHHLPQVFGNAFRTQNNFGDSEASVLVDRMLKVVQFAHKHGATLVDPNELNWMATLSHAKGPEPRVLDVDSWAIGRWPPKAIMPSVRDWHTKGFTTLTDMFALGVVTFQVYIGIHPYRGTLDGFGRYDLEGRMKANASVFTPGVRLNQAVRDFGCIPPHLLGWYQATFQEGERSPMPSPFDVGVGVAPKQVTVLRVTTTAQGSLRIERLFDGANDPAIRVFDCGVALQRSGRLYDLASRREIGYAPSLENCEVVEVTGGWLVGSRVRGELSFSYIDSSGLGAEAPVFQGQGEALVRYQNRLFVVNDRGLSELKLMKFTHPILALSNTWGALRSTEWLDGVGVQDALGAKFLIAPFGSDSCAQVRVRELDGLRVIAAKAGNRFVSTIAIDKQGSYQKLEFVFEKDYSSYRVWAGQADGPELNMATLPRGVVATIVRDGELVIFVPTNDTVNRVTDRDATTDMALANWNDTVVFVRNGQVFSLRMTK